MKDIDTHDLTTDQGRFDFCAEELQTAVEKLGQHGIMSTDIFTALTSIVVSSAAMNNVSKEEFLSFIGDYYDEVALNREHAESVFVDNDHKN